MRAPSAASPPTKSTTSFGSTGMMMPIASMSSSTVTNTKAKAARRWGREAGFFISPGAPCASLTSVGTYHISARYEAGAGATGLMAFSICQQRVRLTNASYLFIAISSRRFRLLHPRQRSRGGEHLTRLDERFEAGEHHRPAAIELLVGVLAQLIVNDDQPAGIADRLD